LTILSENGRITYLFSYVYIVIANHGVVGERIPKASYLDASIPGIKGVIPGVELCKCFRFLVD